METKNTYQFNHNFTIRCATASSQKLSDLFANKNLDNSITYIVELYNKDDQLKKALYFASYVLYNSLNKYTKDPKSFSEKKRIKLGTSLVKYYIRFCTRPTPFGLFSGIGTGSFGNENKITNITLGESSYVRFDMDFLFEVSKDAFECDLFENVLFLKNTTIYHCNGNIRYLEYEFKNNKREYKLQNVKSTDLLEKVLTYCNTERSLPELMRWLEVLGASIAESKNFLGNLISNQILVPSILPTTLDIFQEERLLDNLVKSSTLANVLKESNEIFKRINNITVNEILITDLERVRSKITKALPGHKLPESLFQIDKKLYLSQNKLNLDDVSIFNTLIPLLSRLKFENDMSTLEVFKRAFAERYESKEVSLVQVLDSEIGIGYREAKSVSDMHKGNQGTHWNMVNSFKWNLIQEFSLHRSKIVLEKESFVNLESKNDLLPELMHVMFIPLKKDGKIYYHFKHASGPTPSTLIGRFSHLSSDIENEYRNLGELDKLKNQDFLLAEINHLPQQRLGNIMFRNNVYDYEIAYLSTPSLKKENQIKIEDLRLSMKGDTLYLRCQNRNRYILPRLSCAHNYSINSLPVYNLLCDLQYQGFHDYVGWSWGFLDEEPHLPRIEYKNVIIARAQWCLKKNRINETTKAMIMRYQKQYSLPSRIVIIKGDNELLVDIQTEIGLILIEETFTKNNKLKCTENLLSEFTPLVLNEKHQPISSEVVAVISSESVPIKKKPKLIESISNNTPQRLFPTGDSWIYFKLYINHVFANKLLAYLVQFVQKKKLSGQVEKWFFIRYSDPKYHIRFRILCKKDNYYAILE